LLGLTPERQASRAPRSPLWALDLVRFVEHEMNTPCLTNPTLKDISRHMCLLIADEENAWSVSGSLEKLQNTSRAAAQPDHRWGRIETCLHLLFPGPKGVPGRHNEEARDTTTCAQHQVQGQRHR